MGRFRTMDQIFKTTKSVVALLLGLLIWFGPRGADAQTTTRAERARGHYVDGITLMRSGDFADAAHQLRTAYALAEHPQIAFDLALVYVELNDPVRATEMMKAAVRGRTQLDEATVKRAREVIAELEPEISVVIIETPVRGARVRINGRDVGKTPLGKPAPVRAGEVDIELTAPGKAPGHANLTVKPGFQQSVELSLDRPGVAAQLEIDTDLPGAEILVDGERRGLTDDWDIIHVTPGKHEVSLRREGYLADPKTVVVSPTGITEVQLEAKRDLGKLKEDKGTLLIDVEPAGARIYLDGEAAEAGPIEVVPGRHEVRAEQSLHLTVAQIVEVPAGGRARVNITLPPTAETRDQILDEAEGQRAMVWAFGALGLGLTVGGIAVMSVGIVKSGQAHQTEDDVRASRSCDLGEPECQQGIDKAKADQKVGLGIALGGAGGVALGVGSFALSVWLYLDGQNPDDLRVDVPTDLGRLRIAPDVVVTPQGAYAGIRGAF